MRFGVFQALLGVALVGLAVEYGGGFWALAWPGVAVFVVGVAYTLGAHGVFGKRAEDGRLSIAPAFVLWPYFLVAWALWQLKSRLIPENPYDEVAPGVYVGRRPLHPRELPEGMAVVVDLTSEFARSPSTLSVDKYLALPTLDTTPPPPGALEALLGALGEEPGPIYFHCAMGHGRSATAAAAWMVHRGLAADVDEAIATMKRVRPAIHLHPAQREAVRRLGTP